MNAGDPTTNRSSRLDTYLTSRSSRLDTYLTETGLAAVWFARPNAFAWLTGGSNVVDQEAPVGVAAVGYDGSFHVVTDSIEATRLADEQLPDAFDVVAVDWYDVSLADAVAAASPRPAAADFPVDGFETVDPAPLRQPLSDGDVERYRTLGRDVATAVENVCREVTTSDTERDVAAGVRIGLAARGIEAPVVLVGGSERVQQYRHPTPTENELGRYVVVSVTAARGGLHASLTRTVAFDPPRWLAERHAAAMQVEVSALGATRTVAQQEGTAGDVFDDIVAAYDAVAWPEEWRKHHQGGAAGYAGREWFARPNSTRAVETPMAYAYNPTVSGAKSEDTVLVTDDGFEVLTATGSWPTRQVSACTGPTTVDRHEVVVRE